MTNEEKARELKLYEKAVNVYPDDWCKTNNIAPSDIVHSARMGYQTGALEMAKWKDQQFKEYLEKKKTEMLDKRRKGEGGVDSYYRRRMVEEIIDELFPNTEQDNTDRDE